MSRRPRPQRAATRVVTRPGLLVGQPIKRVEDRKFLTGKANYIDDVRLAGMLHAVFVRSTQAHARVVKIETTDALAQPGVVAVFTGSRPRGAREPAHGRRRRGRGRGGVGRQQVRRGLEGPRGRDRELRRRGGRGRHRGGPLLGRGRGGARLGGVRLLCRPSSTPRAP